MLQQNSHQGSIIKKEVSPHLNRMGLSPEEEDSLLEEKIQNTVVKANETAVPASAVALSTSDSASVA